MKICADIHSSTIERVCKCGFVVGTAPGRNSIQLLDKMKGGVLYLDRDSHQNLYIQPMVRSISLKLPMVMVW